MLIPPPNWYENRDILQSPRPYIATLQWLFKLLQDTRYGPDCLRVWGVLPELGAPEYSLSRKIYVLANHRRTPPASYLHYLIGQMVTFPRGKYNTIRPLSPL